MNVRNKIKWGVVGYFFFQAMVVHAQPPRVISYQGKIEMNGDAALVGEIHAAFYLVAANDAEVGDDGAGALWWEEHPNLVVSFGEFDVVLGERVGFPVEIFAGNDALYLGFKIRVQNEAAEPEWVEVGGPGRRERLISAPYAVAASEAGNFTVRENATVDGTLTVHGDSTYNAVGVRGGDVQFNSDLILSGRDVINPWNEAALRVESGHDTPNQHVVLVMDGNQMDSNVPLHFQNPSRQSLLLGGDLNIAGNLRVDGTILNWFEHAYGGHVQIVWVPANNVVDDVNSIYFRFLGSTDNRFCYLSHTKIVDLHGEDDFAECKIEVENNQWVLRTSQWNAEVFCDAHCFSW